MQSKQFASKCLFFKHEFEIICLPKPLKICKINTCHKANIIQINKTDFKMASAPCNSHNEIDVFRLLPARASID